MGKRKRGKGRKRQGAITKRDPAEKRKRREERDAAADEEESASDDDDDEDDDDDVDASSEAEDEAPESDDGDDADDDDDDADADDDDDDEKAAGDDLTDLDEVPTLDPVEDEGVPYGLPDGAEWAMPLLKLERRWIWLETRMMFVSLIALTVTLCIWIGLRGMTEPVEAQVPAGTVWRALFGAAVLGTIAWIATKGRVDDQKRSIATIVAVIAGLALASTWRATGIAYFEQLRDWLQEGSTITVFGRMKGISTRLTMLVALIGGSLAASTGTHINIDVVLRVIPKHFRRPLAVTTALATAAVCFAASYGFLDHLAVTAYRAKNDAPMSEKIGAITHEMGEQFFVVRKQMVLDFGALPHVVGGGKWSERLNGAEWNEFLKSEGFVERYGEEKVKDIMAPEDSLNEKRRALVQVPGGEATGIMVHFMDLLWPVGFFMLFLKFLLRAVLIVAGHVRVEVEGEAEDEDEGDLETAEEAA